MCALKLTETPGPIFLRSGQIKDSQPDIQLFRGPLCKERYECRVFDTGTTLGPQLIGLLRIKLLDHDVRHSLSQVDDYDRTSANDHIGSVSIRVGDHVAKVTQ